jgi:tetratricopeptide (TPR) repeat protein
VTVRFDFIHREIPQLCCLIIIAVAAFFLTRAVAASNLDMRMRDAAEWYRKGQEALATGRVDAAVDALRRAAVRDRARKAYVLGLARALARNNQADAARGALLALRESAPEDPDVNLELARLSAGARSVDAAIRYYHHALYAPWGAEQNEQRRGVRIELIRFLLEHQQTSRASAEVLALANDLPDDAPHHVEAAQLFDAVGDHARAVDQYDRVLRLDPHNDDARSGAGLASFRLGRYASAFRYLRSGTLRTDEARHARIVSELVLTRDPLADRIGSAERRRRLGDNLRYAETRLADCVSRPNAPADEQDAKRLADLRDAMARLKRERFDQDAIESAADLVDRAERGVAQRCGPPAPLDEALMLIGRQHGSSAP